MANKETIYRLLDELPSYWATESDTTTYEFLYSLALELDVFSTQTTNMRNEIFVDTSTGLYLNQLGRLFRLSRKTGETDDQLRARIKSYWPGFSGGGTIDSFKATLNRITGVPESDIAVVEIDFMKVIVSVVLDSEDDFALVDTILDTLQLIKAAGIWVGEVFVLTGELFSETILATDAITIIPGVIDGWIAGVSLAGGLDVA